MIVKQIYFSTVKISSRKRPIIFIDDVYRSRRTHDNWFVMTQYPTMTVMTVDN